MATETLTATRVSVSLDRPWSIVVHDDPVNLKDYVTWVLQKVFGYDESLAQRLMLEVHNAKRSIVWSGQREKAELYASQLQGFQLTTSLEKST
jgi:ATP-dependent Clp protease adaptor protein ClpS